MAESDSEGNYESAEQALGHFCQTVAALRDPLEGCPWDLKQTHDTLRRYMIEEAYEADEAMASGATASICDELGDVLLQVVLNAQIGSESQAFDVTDVIRAIDEKMVRRHPHVFGSEEQKRERGEEAIRSNWQAIKKSEGRGANTKDLVFDDARKTRPAISQSYRIGKVVSEPSDSVDATVKSIQADTQSLIADVDQGEARTGEIGDRIGNLFYLLAQLSRQFNLDPESLTLNANRRIMQHHIRNED